MMPFTTERASCNRQRKGNLAGPSTAEARNIHQKCSESKIVVAVRCVTAARRAAAWRARACGELADGMR